jgi:hypothetical protein
VSYPPYKPLDPFWPDNLEPEDVLEIHDADPPTGGYILGISPPAPGKQSPTFHMLKPHDARDALLRAIELKRMPYEEYLRTPEWRARASAARERFGLRCSFCSSDDRLEVHHRTYARRGWEREEDLLPLCRDCHAVFHEHRLLAARPRE